MLGSTLVQVQETLHVLTGLALSRLPFANDQREVTNRDGTRLLVICPTSERTFLGSIPCCRLAVP